MNDVVSRLRDYASVAPHSAMGLCTEAADEIERLRKLVTEEDRRAALDRMVEIADESGMYDLKPMASIESLTNETFNLNQKLEEKSVLCNHMANTLREISKHSFEQLHVYINALNAYKAVFDDPSM